MEQQYFTPEISDFRVGYEFEMRFRDDKHWECTVFQATMDIQYLSDILDKRIGKNGGIRVPYLSKEQIEAEGWKYLDEHTIDGSSKLRCVFRNGNYWLTVRFDSTIPIISIIPIDPVQTEFFEQVRYIGQCKCINQFRTITKLLNI